MRSCLNFDSTTIYFCSWEFWLSTSTSIVPSFVSIGVITVPRDRANVMDWCSRKKWNKDSTSSLSHDILVLVVLLVRSFSRFTGIFLPSSRTEFEVFQCSAMYSTQYDFLLFVNALIGNLHYEFYYYVKMMIGYLWCIIVVPFLMYKIEWNKQSIVRVRHQCLKYCSPVIYIDSWPLHSISRICSRAL